MVSDEKMANQARNIQEIVRAVVASLSSLPSTTRNVPQEPNLDNRNQSLQEELNRSFQLPRSGERSASSPAPMLQPQLPASSNSFRVASFQALASNFSSSQSYGSENKKGKAPATRRNSSGRFAPYRQVPLQSH